MSTPCRLLYWMIAAGFLLYILEVPMSWGMPFTINDDDGHKAPAEKDDGHIADGVEDDGQKMYEVEGDGGGKGISATDSSAFMGLRGYRRYFANDSLIGRPVPCTREDKICFRHNLVFDPVTDRCEPLWSACQDGNAYRVVDKTELEHGSGRVVSSCPDYDWKCSGYVMAYDGICYQKEIVRDVICGPNATRTRHILGGLECRVEPITPISVQQPEEHGSCVIPDFRNPDTRRSMLLGEALQYERWNGLRCGSDQGVCFSEGKIFVSGHDGCHTLLNRGPCAEDHVVALDLQAANEGRAEGTCVHVRGGCPKGYKRMAFDGECHEDREIGLEAPGEILLDEFGRYFVSHWGTDKFFIKAAFDGNQSCKVQRIPMRTLVPTIPPALLPNPFSPPCGIDDLGKCKLYEVENIPPIPII